MRHNVDGRKFGRNTSHRNAMFRNMANSVILMEQVETTVQKAKEVRRVVDRLITLAKKGTPASRRLAFDRTRSEAVVDKLFDSLSTRYKARNGGYTRVLKISDRRWGDAAEVAVLELVDHPEIDRRKKTRSTPKAENAADSAKAAEPFGRFKKIFAPSKGKASGETKGAKTKSTAGGGASKKGGNG